MNSNTKKVDELNLHAYVDGLLDEEQIKEVESLLLIDDAAAAMVDSIRRQNDIFKQSFNSVLDEKIPERLISVVSEKKNSYRIYRIAAAISLFLLGSIFGWILNYNEPGSPAMVAMPANFVKQAVLAHAVYTPEVRHPVEVTASNEKHLVAWLSKRLGTSIDAPQLTTQGFNLIGGRLLPGNTGPSAQFMYEDNQGQRFTLYVRKIVSEEETAFRYTNEDGLSTFYWVDNPLVYALIGNVDREQLLSLAHLVYEHLNKSPDNVL